MRCVVEVRDLTVGLPFPVRRDHDRRAVLVGPAHREHVVALQPVVAREHVERHVTPPRGQGAGIPPHTARPAPRGSSSVAAALPPLAMIRARLRRTPSRPAPSASNRDAAATTGTKRLERAAPPAGSAAAGGATTRGTPVRAGLGRETTRDSGLCGTATASGVALLWEAARGARRGAKTIRARVSERRLSEARTERFGSGEPATSVARAFRPTRDVPARCARAAGSGVFAACRGARTTSPAGAGALAAA